MVTYRADIDGLRAIAILPVVLYHAGIPGFGGGYVGVDVFFVISSFLITSILVSEIGRDSFSLLSFYERRARRILPALTVVIVATFAIGALVLLPSEMDALGKSAFATTIFLSNFHFASSIDYFAAASEFRPLLHTWSLAVEEQFYLFFPPLLYLMYRLGGRRLAVWCVALLSIASLALAIVILPKMPGWTFFMLPTRAWELGVGALLALLPTSLQLPRRSCDALAMAGIMSILLPVLQYDHATAFPGLAALPPVLGTAILIQAGRSGGSTINRILSARIMVWVGLISYSLYLWHWPVMALLRSSRGAVDLPLWLGLCAVGLSIALATITYRLVEKPFRRRPPFGFRRGTIFSLSAVSLCLTAGLGAVFALSNGAPGRLPAEVRAIAAAANDTNPRRGACFGKTPNRGLCNLGVRQAETADFLLWGDSHALALMPALDLAAGQADLSGIFAGHSACLPLPGLHRVPENPSCSNLNRQVMTFLEERDDIDLVVLSGRWTLSVEGTRFGEEPGHNVRLTHTGLEAPGKPVNSESGGSFHGATPLASAGLGVANAGSDSGADNASLVEQALAETVAAIRATGRDVLILGPVPEPGWDVPLRAAKSAMVFGRPLPAPLSRADYIARAGRTETILDRVAAYDTGVTHHKISSVLCDETCPTTDTHGIPLYSDDDHLTLNAARTLLPAPLMAALVHAIP